MFATRKKLIMLAALTMASSGAAAERRIEKEIIIAAPRNDVWHAWTTSEGLPQVGPIAAKVELQPGGAYEWYFSLEAPEGQRGGEGCKVLAFIPQEFLAVSWNAPPSIPTLRNAGAKTQLFVKFTEMDPKRTLVSLSHLITEEGADWDKYLKYFDSAWTGVLMHAKRSLEKPDRQPAPAARRLQVPPLEQIVDVRVPADKLWKACIDPTIARQWAAPVVQISPKLGGLYHTNYDANAAADADSWVVREITCFDPGRLLGLQMKHAPAKFPHKAAIERTTHLLFFEPMGNDRSRLRMVMTGLAQDDASRAMREYFEKANPTVFEKLRKVLEGS